MGGIPPSNILHNYITDNKLFKLQKLFNKYPQKMKNIINTHDPKTLQTLLMTACKANNFAAVHLLVKYGAKVDIPPSTPPLLSAAVVGNLHMVELLLDNKCDINTQNANGQTAINCAIETGNIDLLRYLLSKGADPNILDKNKHTCLLSAVLYYTNKTYMVKLLNFYGATPSVADIEALKTIPGSASQFVLTKEREAVSKTLRALRLYNL